MRGANGADLAMNVVLPEVDGRIFTRAISFKEEAPLRLAAEFSETRHAPERSRIDFVADLALNWARLRRKPNAEKSLALILSDYPARRGRGGYAIGLDAEASVHEIVSALIDAGYDVGGDAENALPSPARGRGWRCEARSGEGPHPSSLRDDTFSRQREKVRAPSLLRCLEDQKFVVSFPLADYLALLSTLPRIFRRKRQRRLGRAAG